MLLLAFLPSESFTPSACAAHQSSRTAPRTAAVLASESDGPSPEEWREFRQKLVCKRTQHEEYDSNVCRDEECEVCKDLLLLDGPEGLLTAEELQLGADV